MNSADNSGASQYLLPRERHVAKNRDAISFVELLKLFKCIYEKYGNTASGRSFLFAVLTATRSGTARLAIWEQIDLENEEWIIPLEQLKMSDARIPHRSAGWSGYWLGEKFSPEEE